MKRTHAIILSIVLFAAGVCLSVTGCATTGTRNPHTVARTSAIVKTSAQLGVFYALRKDAGLAPWFQSAHVVLTVLVHDRIVDPEQVRAALLRADTRFNRDDVIIPVTAALEFYTVFYGDVVRDKLDQVDYLLPVLTALRDGIALGMNAPATKAEFNP